MAILEVSDINKRFSGLQALNNVNLKVEEGSVHAIIGPNGAGKSTLLNCFVGLITPDSGSVTFDGKSLLGLAPHQINQAGVCRVFQTPEIFGDQTVRENVLISAFAKRDGPFKIDFWSRLDQQDDVAEETENILEDLGLIDQSHVLGDSLSRGDKRRLELAMCLVQNPKLLLLDEPTAGMSRADTNATIDLLKKIGERGITKIVIEHDMSVVFALSDKISVLARGRIIAEGAPQDVRRDPVVIEAYLGGELG